MDRFQIFWGISSLHSIDLFDVPARITDLRALVHLRGMLVPVEHVQELLEGIGDFV